MKKKIAIYGYAGSGKDYVFEQLCKRIEKDKNYPFEVKRFAFADPARKSLSDILGLNFYERTQFQINEKFKNNTYVNLKTFQRVYVENASDMVYSELKKAFHIKNEFFILDSETVSEIGAPEKDLTKYLNDTLSLSKADYFISLRNLMVYYATYVVQKGFGNRIWVRSVFNSPEFKESENRQTDIICLTDLRFPSEYQACLDNGFSIINISHDNTINDSSKTVKNIAEKSYDFFTPDFTFVNSLDKKVFDEELESLVKFIFS